MAAFPVLESAVALEFPVPSESEFPRAEPVPLEMALEVAPPAPQVFELACESPQPPAVSALETARVPFIEFEMTLPPREEAALDACQIQRLSWPRPSPRRGCKGRDCHPEKNFHSYDDIRPPPIPRFSSDTHLIMCY